MGASGVAYPKASLSSASPVPSTLNRNMKLVTTDEKKTVIAQFHRAHYVVKKKKARIEVQPAGMEMLDYIILTFVFAENGRRDQEGTSEK
jgi:hypothetical protein